MLDVPLPPAQNQMLTSAFSDFFRCDFRFGSFHIQSFSSSIVRCMSFIISPIFVYHFFFWGGSIYPLTLPTILILDVLPHICNCNIFSFSYSFIIGNHEVCKRWRRVGGCDGDWLGQYYRKCPKGNLFRDRLITEMNITGNDLFHLKKLHTLSPDVIVMF